MVEPKDVKQLQAELEALRANLASSRESLREELDGLIERSGQMRERSAGGKFEPAVTVIHELLLSLRRGIEAQQRMAKQAANLTM